MVQKPHFTIRAKFSVPLLDSAHDSGREPGSTEGNYIDWLTFSDNAKSVVEDVLRIRNHPLVPNDIPINGYIYEVKSGKLIEVPEATTVGRAS